MEPSFLTISEAASKSGRSLSTIRRIIRTITDAKSHPDRAGIQPSIAEVAQLKKKGEIFSWRIRDDVLEHQLKIAPKEEKKKATEQQGDILSILRRELELKNGQIEKQWEVIHALNDRLREGNILMGSLQQRLALPEAPSKHGEPVEATVVQSSMDASKEPSKEGKKRSAKTSSSGVLQKSSKKDSRRGWLGWLVG